MLSIRCLVVTAALLILAGCSQEKAGQIEADLRGALPAMTVYKQPSCGCCGEWVEHVREKGFQAQVQNRKNMAQVKTKFGIQPEYQSCHTAIVGEYVFEGHIPAHAIAQFLENPPQNAIGLAVPGMPVGSPGMEMGDRFDEYDVLLLKDDGSSEMYLHVSSPVAVDDLN